MGDRPVMKSDAVPDIWASRSLMGNDVSERADGCESKSHKRNGIKAPDWIDAANITAVLLPMKLFFP